MYRNPKWGGYVVYGCAMISAVLVGLAIAISLVL